MSKFKNASEIVEAVSRGAKLKILSGNFGGRKKGDLFYPDKGTAFLSGVYAQFQIGGVSYNFSVANVELAVVTVGDLNADIHEAEETIATAKAKIKYLEQSGSQEFDETEFKVWNTLQLLKGKKNDLEKAKAIAALINA